MTDRVLSSAATVDPRDPFTATPNTLGLDRPSKAAPRADLRIWFARLTARGPGPKARVGPTGMLTLLAVIGVVAVAATDQVVPATSAHQAQVRIWLASRAAGITALTLLAAQILIGLLLSHPTNKTTWRLSRLIFPWHDTLWLFVLAFAGVHVISIIVDPFAGVGLGGAIVPGLSSYRSAPVALGTLSLYALLVTGVTARWTRILPAGAWLVVHRAGAAIFVVAWAHGLLAGTDSLPLVAWYLVLGVAILAAAAHRLWTSPRGAEVTSR